jgi:hypothetical protein
MCCSGTGRGDQRPGGGRRLGLAGRARRGWGPVCPAPGAGSLAGYQRQPPEALERLTRPPFVLGAAGSHKQRVTGLGLLLDWLADQPGRSWQERWLASGADAAGSRWRQVPAGWLRARSRYCEGAAGRFVRGAARGDLR